MKEAEAYLLDRAAWKIESAEGGEDQPTSETATAQPEEEEDVPF
ncbi:MAG: hypothetical protein AAFX93_00030 [Verrucomicrobiota bacterium]